MPPVGDEPVELCGQPVQGRCEVQFRQVQGPRIQGDAHDGRHHRPRTGKGRTDHREDRRRPRRPGCAPRGAGALEEDPRNGAEGPPYGSGHHGRGRHARRAGSALRHAGGDRLRRRGAEVPRSGGLRRFGEDGRRARRLPGLRRREGGEQPDDRPYPRGRSGALRGDDEGGPPQYRHADHRAHGNHVAHVADHFGHRAGVPHRLQAPPQDQSFGRGHPRRLRGRNGRKVPGVQRLPS